MVEATRNGLNNDEHLESHFYDFLQIRCLRYLYDHYFLSFKNTESCTDMQSVLKKRYNYCRGSDFEYIDVLGEGCKYLIVSQVCLHVMALC